MDDGVLTSSLVWANYFSVSKFCRKTGGHVLTPNFGTVKNLINMASNGEVIYMKKFRIIDKIIYHFYLYLYLFPLFFFFLILRPFFLLQGSKPRGPRGGQANLGHPIVVARLDGVPPGRVGFWVIKSARRIACVPRFWPGLLRPEPRCITLGVEGTQ